MVDLHKEIKLSDLFSRKPRELAEAKEPGEPKADKAPKEEKPKKERRRREKPPKQPKARRSAPTFAHEAPPLPEIPLMRAFNLLPKEEVRQTKEGTSPLPQVLVALAGVLVFAALAAFYLTAGTDVTKKKGKIEDLRAELAAYQAPKQQPSVEEKSSALVAERLQRTTALGSALTTRIAWDRVLRELALVIPEDVTLDTIQATAPSSPLAAPPADGSPVKNFTITGSTASQASVAELLARLAVIPELGAVRLESAQLQPAGSDPTAAGPKVVKFTVSGTMRTGS